MTQQSLQASGPGAAIPTDSRKVLSDYLRTKTYTDQVVPALTAITGDIGNQVKRRTSLEQVPAAAVANVRNDMYLTSEAIKVLQKSAGTMAANRSGLQWATLRNLLMAGVLTLPVAIVLSGSLYWLFTHIF